MAVRDGVIFDGATHGLVIDNDSAYEDCAYVTTIADETPEARMARIDGLVKAMVASYGGAQGILAPSFDPLEREQNITALEGEWNLLKKQIRPAAPDDA